MARSDYYADSRPRIKKQSEEDISKIKDKLNHMIENDENKEYIKEHFCGKQGKLSKAEIIDESLEALKERGLIDE